jgi:hypothetical protein
MRRAEARPSEPTFPAQMRIPALGQRGNSVTFYSRQLLRESLLFYPLLSLPVTKGNYATKLLHRSGHNHEGYRNRRGLLMPAFSARAQYTSQDISADVTANSVVNVKQLATASTGSAGSAGGEVHANRFPRLAPPMRNLGPAIDQAPMTALASVPDSMHLLFRGFTGLTHLDQRLANGGNQFSTEPPDQGLAVGNGFVLEGVNCAINVYDTNGVVQLPRPLALTELFGLPPAINRTTGQLGVFVGMSAACLILKRSAGSSAPGPSSTPRPASHYAKAASISPSARVPIPLATMQRTRSILRGERCGSGRAEDTGLPPFCR